MYLNCKCSLQNFSALSVVWSCVHPVFFSLSKQFSIQLNWHGQNGKHTHVCAHTDTQTHHTHVCMCVCVCVCVITPAGTETI